MSSARAWLSLPLIFAVPLAALAQSGEVQLYGRASLALDRYTATGSANGAASDLKARTRVSDVNSRIGIRGFEDLGTGLRATYLIESGVNIDTGTNLGQNGAVNTSTGAFASRGAYVGLQGGWGEVRLGKQNLFWISPYINETGSNWISSGIGIQSGGIGRGMGIGVVRQNNTLSYITPMFAGFHLDLAFSPDRAEAQQGGVNTNGRLYSAMFHGTNGPFGLNAYWVRSYGNSAVSGTPSQGHTDGKKLSGRWNYLPNAAIYAVALQSEVANGGPTNAVGSTSLVATGLPDPLSATITLKQRGFLVGSSVYFGNFHSILEYGRLSRISGCATANACNDTGATGFIVAFRYLFSRRTHAYISYQQLRNQANYNIDWTGGAQTSAVGLPRGADPKITVIGIIHNF